MKIETSDREFLNILRGASILRVIMVHLGLSWFYPPYSQYINVLLPIFFFVSGAVSFNSVVNNSHRQFYFAKRYLSLIIPFFLFSLPFLITNIADANIFSFYGLVQWLMAWPPMATYPFDMRQLWFINTLILMFVISYPVFLLAKKSVFILLAAFIVSALYVPIAEQFNFIGLYKENSVLNELSISMQLHQSLALMNYYLFGALFYQIKHNKNHIMIAAVALLAIMSFYLYPDTDALKNLRTFLFERGSYFTALSYICIFIALIFKDLILKFFNKLTLIKKLLLKMNVNSYALFLIHTPLILVFERYLGFDELGDKPVLALVKMLGVIAASVMLAPVLTYLNNKVLKLLK